MAHNNMPNTLKHSLHDPHVGDGWMPSLSPQKHVDCLTPTNRWVYLKGQRPGPVFHDENKNFI